MALLRSFWTDDSGQTLTEYAIIIAVVSIALIATLVLFRNEIAAVFNRIIGTLQQQAPGA